MMLKLARNAHFAQRFGMAKVAHAPDIGLQDLLDISNERLYCRHPQTLTKRAEL